MRFFDLQISFFVPLWRRVVLVVFCLGWAAVEFAAGAPFWGLIFGGTGVLALWQFFFDDWPTPADTQAWADSQRKSVADGGAVNERKTQDDHGSDASSDGDGGGGD